MQTVLDYGRAERLRRGQASQSVYYLVWRLRPNHPWSSEEFETRMGAYDRYFALMQRGVEAYLSRRQRTLQPAGPE